MFIYVIVCNESVKLYVGQHKGNNLRQYLQQKWSEAQRGISRRSHLYNAMKKYPRGSWSIWPLVSGVENRAELDELEKHFIRVLKSQHDDIGYNICRGGEGFTGPHTAETWAKIHAKRDAYWAKPENHEETSRRFKEMWADPAFKEKMSQIHKQTSNSGRFRLGHAYIIGSSAKGPNKTSFKVGNKPWNTGTKGVKKSLGQRKAVLCVDTDEVFPSMSAAAQAYRTYVGNIRRAIATNTKAGGQRWAYIEQA
jgi:GIY-YIG catalytic domain